MCEGKGQFCTGEWFNCNRHTSISGALRNFFDFVRTNSNSARSMLFVLYLTESHGIQWSSVKDMP